MTIEHISLIAFLFFIIAILYSTVGHAGASGYLAIMGILSFAPDSIKPISLVLNIVVASIASYKFIKADYFNLKIFLYFICTSIPFAFLGGYISISPKYFKLVAGLFLVASAILLILKTLIKPKEIEPKPIPLIYGLSIGSLVGLFSGLIGVGGGIFLSPILIMANWTTVKKASGIAALFILCNSISGLLGHIIAFNNIDSNIIYWIIAVALGGFIGSYLGTKKFNSKIILGFLFSVLLTAGLKFIFIDFLK